MRSLWLWAVVAVVLASCSTSAASPTSGALPYRMITTYHGGVARQGFVKTSTINAADAPTLTQQWAVYGTPPISAQAVVAGHSIYWGDWNGMEHATTLSGAARWSTFVGTAPKPRTCPFPLGNLGVTSSATVGRLGSTSVLWVGGGGGRLYALNADTGHVLWRTRLGAPPENVLWSSPVLYDGSVYEGVASWNDCPGVVYGKMFRLNAATGSVEGVFSPEARGCVGGGIWSSPTVDVSANALFVTTGNDDCNSPAQNSIFKLNATTLATESHWRTPKDPFESDADFGSTPTLFTATVNGVSRPLVGGEAKDGTYYAFDRRDLAAGPVWTYDAEGTATQKGRPCLDLNTISSSAWSGSGAPVMVAGLVQADGACLGTLAALNPATGIPEWSIRLPGAVLGAVTEAPGVVAVGSATTVLVLSSTTGATLFSYPEPHQRVNKGDGYGQPYWFWASPAIAGDSLYIGNEDGTLRAFSVAPSPAAVNR